MGTLFHLLFNTLAVLIAAYLLPGVRVESFLAALVVAVVVGILNAIVRPLLILLTLPITLLTFGLFAFVINALLILLASALVPGFSVSGFSWALLFSIVLSLVNWFLSFLEPAHQ